MPMASMAKTATEPAVYQQESPLSPYMMYIRDIQSNLQISGTTATVDSSVKGENGSATKAKVLAELQVKNGNSFRIG